MSRKTSKKPAPEMKAPSHTPGPWRDGGCYATERGERRGIDVLAERFRKVATVRTGADAQLIVAAPELLERLRQSNRILVSVRRTFLFLKDQEVGDGQKASDAEKAIGVLIMLNTLAIDRAMNGVDDSEEPKPSGGGMTPVRTEAERVLSDLGLVEVLVEEQS